MLSGCGAMSAGAGAGGGSGAAGAGSAGAGGGAAGAGPAFAKDALRAWSRWIMAVTTALGTPMSLR